MFLNPYLLIENLFYFVFKLTRFDFWFFLLAEQLKCVMLSLIIKQNENIQKLIKKYSGVALAQ